MKRKTRTNKGRKLKKRLTKKGGHLPLIKKSKTVEAIKCYQVNEQYRAINPKRITKCKNVLHNGKKICKIDIINPPDPFDERKKSHLFNMPTCVHKTIQFGGKLKVPNDICILPEQTHVDKLPDREKLDDNEYIELKDLRDDEILDRNNRNISILESIIEMWERNKYEWFQNIDDIKTDLEEAVDEDLNAFDAYPHDEMSEECKNKWKIQYGKLIDYILFSDPDIPTDMEGGGLYKGSGKKIKYIKRSIK